MLKDDPIDGDALDQLKTLKARRLHPDAVFTYQSDRTREYNGVAHVKGQRRPMTYDRFYKVWTAACKEVGITDLNPHCIRHTGATRAYWETRDINMVSDLLNHADVRTTKRYYLKTNPEVVRDALRQISANRKKKVSAKVSARKLEIAGIGLWRKGFFHLSEATRLCLVSGSNLVPQPVIPLKSLHIPLLSALVRRAGSALNEVQKSAIGGKSVGESIGKTIGAFAPVLPVNPAISRSLTPGKENAHAP